MSTETDTTTTPATTTNEKPTMLAKMKTKVKKTLNKLKGGKKNKNKNKNKNKKNIDETQPKDATSDQADLADKELSQDGASKQGKQHVLGDAAHYQTYNPFGHEKVDDIEKQAGQGQQHDLMGKHDGIDGPYSQENHPVLESPSRQHDVPSHSSLSDEGIRGREDSHPQSRDSTSRQDESVQGLGQGLPQLDDVPQQRYDPYQKKHAVLEGKHDLPSLPTSTQGASESSTQGAPVSSTQGAPVSSTQGVPVSSTQDAPSSSTQGASLASRDSSIAPQAEIERALGEQRAALEREKAEKLKLLEEKEVFQHATTNLLQVKGQLVGDMLQLQMDVDKLQMEKMQLEADRGKREQEQIKVQQERAQLQMDKDKLIKEKSILEQPGVVGKLTNKVKTAIGAGTGAEAAEQAAEVAEIDRTVLGTTETPAERKGMLSQISDKVKGVLSVGQSSSGPTAEELNAYEAGLVKAGFRSEDETDLHPVEQQGMLASISQKVKGAVFGGTPTATETSSVPASEQQGVLSKISSTVSQLVFGTESGATTTSTTTDPVSTDHGIDHTKCARSFENIHPTKIDMDIADNRSAVPLAEQRSDPIQADVTQADPTLAVPQNISTLKTKTSATQADPSTLKTKTSTRTPRKSPKKIVRRGSKNVKTKAKVPADR